MKRIISTLLSLSLVLSLLPTVALAEGEDSRLAIQYPNPLSVGQSDYVILWNETETDATLVTEDVTWEATPDSIVQVEPITEDDLANMKLTDPSSVVNRSVIAKVTGLKAGEAEISAETASGKATCTITVEAPVLVESITLDEHNLTCDSLEPIYQLSYKFNPTKPTNQDVEWKSSNPKVVDVTSTGLVMPKKPGTASITVTALDGSEASDSCKVIVTAPKRVQGISLSPGELTITEDDEFAILTASVLPEDATDKTIIWTSSDPSVATVNKNGEVFPVANGDATISAMSNDEPAAKAECKVHVDLSTHNHKWSTCWDADRVKHYHICSKCGETKDNEEHDFSNGDTCSVCGLGKNGEKIQLTNQDRLKMKKSKFIYTGEQIDFLGGTKYNNIIMTLDSNLKAVDTPLEVVVHNIQPIQGGDKDYKECGRYWAEVTVSTGLYEVSGTLDFYIVQVTLDQEALDFNEVRTTQKLTPTIKGEDSTRKGVTWTSSDETVATVDKDGVVTAVSEGTATITATANDGSGAKATCSVTVDIPAHKCTFTKKQTVSNDTKHWIVCDTCGHPKDEGQEHNYGEWSHDDNNHWKECSVCGRRKDEDKHHIDDWGYNTTSHWLECDVCKAKIDESAHQLGEWIIDQEATTTTPGEKHRICTCGYKVTETIPVKHEHQYSDQWTSDATNHWHACECGEKSDLSAHQFKWVIDREATATQPGEKHQECTTCGYKTAPVTIPMEHVHKYSDKWSSDATNHWHECECGEKSDQGAHQFQWVIDREATTTKTGRKHQVCATCGYQTAAVTIPKKSAPTVSVKDSTVTVSNKSQTTKLDVKADKDAKLTYKSDNKSVKVDKNGKVTIAKNFVGKATITVTATSGSVKSTKKVTITVNPKGTTFRSVYNGAGKKLKAYWNRNSQVSGYQLQYGTSKNFTGCKTVTLNSNKYTGSVRTGLKKNATYYVRIRTYKRVSGKTYYSAWSKVKSFKVVR